MFMICVLLKAQDCVTDDIYSFPGQQSKKVKWINYLNIYYIIFIAFDLSKLQIEPIAKGEHSKYSGVVQATLSIVREEGWRALWKGHVPAQALSILYGMAQVR